MLHVKNLHKSYQIGKQSYEVLKGYRSRCMPGSSSP